MDPVFHYHGHSKEEEKASSDDSDYDETSYNAEEQDYGKLQNVDTHDAGRINDLKGEYERYKDREILSNNH